MKKAAFGLLLLALLAILIPFAFRSTKPPRPTRSKEVLTDCSATPAPVLKETLPEARNILETARRLFGTEELREEEDRTERVPTPFRAALEAVRTVRYESNANGELIPKDLPYANILAQSYPDRYDAPMSIADGAMKLEILPIGGAASPVSIQEGALLYPEIRPGVHALRFPMPNRTEEFLLLERPGTGTEFRYALTLSPEVRTIREISGYYEFQDSNAISLIRLHPAKGWDNQGREIKVGLRLEGLNERERRPSGEVSYDAPSNVDLALTFEAAPSAYPILIDPQWSDTEASSVSWNKQGVAQLADGRILICGGYDTGAISLCELFNPITRRFSAAAPMTQSRYEHSVTPLPDGRILVVGSGSAASVDTYEIYTPDSSGGTWFRNPLKPTGFTHRGSTATLLRDGRVLLVGDSLSTSNDHSEIYNPIADTWTPPVVSMPRGVKDHTATLLADGRVLVVGGHSGVDIQSSCWYFDPATNSFSAAPPLPGGREMHSATLLRDGRLVVAGGRIYGVTQTDTFVIFNTQTNLWSSFPNVMPVTRREHAAALTTRGKIVVGGGNPSTTSDTTAVFDPITNTWASDGVFSVNRNFGPVMAVTVDGSVIVIGGTSANAAFRSAEVFDEGAGTWSAAANLPEVRYHHASSVLPDGRVLVTGGFSSGTARSDCRMYDPTVDRWTPATSMNVTRYRHTASLLPTGLILVAGGAGGGSTSCELYDPSTARWSGTGSLGVSRYHHSAVVLRDGRVLVAGGYSASDSTAACEIYDPRNGRWTATAPMSRRRYQHTATLLPDGRVLIAGGMEQTTPLDTAEIYNPVSNAWTPVGLPIPGGVRYAHSSTLLRSGMVLIAGGNNGTSSLASCAYFDPVTSTWSAAPALVSGRDSHASVLLPNGRLLLSWGNPTSSGCQIFDPLSNQWNMGGPVASARYNHTANLLTSGSVLSTGGWTGFSAVATSDRYSDIASTPTGITSVNGQTGFPVAVEFGSTVSVRGTGFRGNTQAASSMPNSCPSDRPFVILQRVSSRDGNSTGGGGDDQIYLRQASDWTSGTDLNFTIPPSSQIGTGYYYLFVSAGGVYCDAKILKVTSDASPPIAGAVNNGTGADIDFQGDTTTLSANWSGFSDPQTGIVSYEWAIGTAPGAADVQPFLAVGTATSATATGLALLDGQTYHVTVRATNGGALTSTAFDDAEGITIRLNSPPIVSPQLPANGVILNARRPTFQARIDAPETAQKVHLDIKIDDTSYVHATDITGSGTVTWTPASDLSEGPHTWTCRAHDELGSYSAEQTLTFTIDTTPPTVASNTITTPDGGELWPSGLVRTITWDRTRINDVVSGNACTIELRASFDSGATFPIQIANGLANGGSYDWTVSNQQESTRCRVRLIATDAAGNTGALSQDMSNADFSIDVNPPIVSTVRAGVPSGTYGATSVIPVLVTFSETITVTPGATPPNLTLATSPSPTSTVYRGFTAPNTLRFEYTVQPGQSANPLEYTSRTALVLNGAIITDLSGKPADPLLPVIGSGGSLASSGIVIDTSAPDTTITGRPTNPSRETNPTFTFTASKMNCTFRRRIDGLTWTVVTSPDTLSGLSNGPHTYDVKAVDPAGNEDLTPATYTWTIDTLPPDTSLVSGPSSPTSSRSATLAFSSNEAGSTFERSLNGGAWSPVTSPETLNSLPDGEQVYQVRAIDAAGNVDATPVVHRWTVDTQAPDTSITATPSALSNSANAVFQFTSTETGTFRRRLDGGAWTTATSPETLSALSEGSHLYEVKAVDGAGNEDPIPASYSWTVDTVAPNTSFTMTPPNPSNSTDALFAFSSTEAGSRFQKNLDGAGWVDANNPDVLSGLAVGTHVYQVRAIDAAGNLDATPASFSWTIDNGPPETTLVPGPAAITKETTATFTFSSNEAGTFLRRLDTGAWVTAVSPEVLSGLTDGSHTYTVKAVDTTGNEDSSPASFSWLVDTQAPATPANIQYSPNPNNTGTHVISWDAVSDSGSAIVSYEIRRGDNGGPWTNVATVTGTSWTQSPALSQGDYLYQVRATDAAGNVGSYSTNTNVVRVIIDTTPPSSGFVNDGFFADIDWQNNPRTIAANWAAFFDAETGVTSYRWAVGSSPGAEDILPFQFVGNTTAAFANVSLSEGIPYYVTVEATNGVGLTVRASSDGVTVDSIGPIAPTLLTPLNGTTVGASAGIQFDWTDVSDASAYRLQVDNESTFTAPLIMDLALTNSEFTAGSLPPGTFSWRVLAVDAAQNWSLPSSVFTFTATGASRLAVTAGPMTPPAGNELNTARELSVAQFRFLTGPLEDIQLNSITVSGAGTGHERDHVSSVALFHDVNSNGLKDNLDILLSHPTTYLEDNGSVTFDSLSQMLPAGSEYDVLVVYDLNGTAPLAATFQARIALDTHVNAYGLSSARTVIPVGGFPVDGNPVTIVSSGTPGYLSVATGSQTPVDGYCATAEQSVEFLQIQLHASSVEAVRISRFSLQTNGTGIDSSDVSQYFLARDVNENGIFNAGVDEVLGLAVAPSDNGIVTFLLDRTVEPGTTIHWLIAADFAGSAAYGATFSLSTAPEVDMAAAGLTSGVPLSPDAAPLSGALLTIGASGSPGSLTITSLPFEVSYAPFPFARNVPVLRFQLSAGGLEDVLVSQLRIRASGSGDDSSAIQRAILWEDLDNNDEFSPDRDAQVALLDGPFPGDDGTMTFVGFDRTIPAGATRTWFVSYDLSGHAVGGTTFQLSFTVSDTPPPVVTSGKLSNLFLTAQGGTISGPVVQVQPLPASSGQKKSKSCLASAGSTDGNPVLLLLLSLFLLGFGWSRSRGR